ncbi:seed maturation protein [Sarocladium implicatum]|nr:seed maturation protein [Sarocladium implicatum]
MPGNHPLSKSDAGRIQSHEARSGSNMSSGGFAARAQAARDRNANASSGGHAANSRGGGNHNGGGNQHVGQKK